MRRRPGKVRSVSAGGTLRVEGKFRHRSRTRLHLSTSRRKAKSSPLDERFLRRSLLTSLTYYSLLNRRISTDPCAKLLIEGAFLLIGCAILQILAQFYRSSASTTTREKRLIHSPEKRQNDAIDKESNPGGSRTPRDEGRQLTYSRLPDRTAASVSWIRPLGCARDSPGGSLFAGIQDARQPETNHLRGQAVQAPAATDEGVP